MTKQAEGQSSLLLATANKGKIRELKRLFQELPFQLLSLADFENVSDVDETGSTFRENAELKARGFASQTGQLSLADDSGLEIEALGNEPGVHSARFAGENTGYDVKIPTLLGMLDGTGDETRAARFVCVMALAAPDGQIINTAEGICTGSIAKSPRGDLGFGYDPIFIPEGFDRTFGELGDDVKGRVSHRAIASRLIIRYLLHFTAV